MSNYPMIISELSTVLGALQAMLETVDWKEKNQLPKEYYQKLIDRQTKSIALLQEEISRPGMFVPLVTEESL